MTASESSPKVLYLIGKGRAGGTLLNNILGQIDGFVAPGELTRLWTWGLGEGWSCGCGRSVKECPFWTDAVARIEADGVVDPERVAAIQSKIQSWRSVPRMFREATRPTPRWAELNAYIELLGRTYRALATAASANVIVESTRWPVFPTAFGMVPGVDVYLLHLVRDPRAVAYSWRRKKRLIDRPGEPEMQSFGPVYTTTSWWLRSALAEAVGRRAPKGRYLRVRYEDVIAEPQTWIPRIGQWASGTSPDTGFLGDDSASLEPTHTVGGNPNRLSTGRVPLRLDDEWIDSQSRPDRIISSVMAMPFLQVYGYPLRVSRAQPAIASE